MELGDPGRRAQRRIWIIYPFEKRKEVFLLKKSWRNFSKRGLSLLVCLVMCLSMLPGVAWAAEEDTHEYEYVTLAADDKTCPKRGCSASLTYKAQVDPTCTKEGVVEHYECSTGHNSSMDGSYYWNKVPRIEPLDHDYSVLVEGTSTATCSNGGTVDYKCVRCLETNKKDVGPTGNHDFSGEWTITDEEHTRICGNCAATDPNSDSHNSDESFGAVTATCVTAGVTAGSKCSVCGKTMSDPVTGGNDFSNHANLVEKDQEDATCSEAGHKAGTYCEDCKTWISGGEEIPLESHSYAWTTTEEASCTKEGSQKGVCNVCGGTITEKIPMTQHTPKDASKAATCTEDGVVNATVCEVCGAVIAVGTSIEKLGHEFGEKWISDDGSHWRQCTRCDKKQDEADHTYGEPTYEYTPGRLGMGTLSEVRLCTICDYKNVEQKGTSVSAHELKPTCTEYGKIRYTARVKNSSGKLETVTLAEVIDQSQRPLGHLEPSGDWNQNHGAVYGHSGEHVKLCGRKNPNTNRPCNEVVAHEAHSYLLEETFKEPTCTEKGYTRNLCKDCGFNKGGNELAPLGHDYGDPTWKWNATSGSATATFTCTRNGCTHVETVKAGVTSVTEPANCIKEGSITYMATVTFNEKTYTAEKVVTTPATGIHDYDEDGVCKICGDVHPTDHKHVYDMEKGTVTTKATCTMQGVTSYPCKYCNATLEVVALPLGHEYTSEVTTPATCIAEGVQTYTCHREGCSDFYTEGLPLVPHTLTVHAKKEPACTENGMKAHSTCSVCNGFFTGAGTSLKETTEEALTILAIGHAYGAWTITAAPTMSAPGAARRVCANDASHVETVELPQLPAPGTPDSVWTLDTERSAAPTCTESGENMYVSVYGEVRANVPALGHSFSDTWTYDGASHWHACARCGIAGGAAAHAYDGGVVTLAPTADTAGVRTYTCTACGRYYTEAIPATGTTGPVFPAPDPGTPGGGSGGTNNPPPAETIIDEDTPLADITFDDVMPTDPFYEAVQYVFNRKLMNGVSDTSFDPYGTLTRAMVVTILYRLEGEPAAEPSAFLDVAAGQWYTDAVGWGAANKVVKGYSEDRFGPMDPVTREQLAAILHRYAQYKGYEVTEITDLTAYADMASISEYALEAMAWAIALGAPEALSETALAPRDNATRAQVAVAFMNFCEKYIPLETEGEAA